jgi:sugar lactone lactonase YvrE
MRIEVLVDVKTILGEGPLWDVEEQRLYWIDSFGMNVFRATADGREIRAWDVPQKIGSMSLRKSGGAVVSLARGFHFLDLRTGNVELIVDPEPGRTNRLSDGKMDQRGPSSPARWTPWRKGPAGRYAGSDLSLHKLDDKIIVSNGPC